MSSLKYKENERVNMDFRKRFISDFNLPIQVYHEPYFSKRLTQLEKLYEAESKFYDTLSLIENRFEGKVGLFLDEYYKIRENIIQSMLHNEAYIKFNTSLDIFKEISSFENKTQYPKKNPYTEDLTHKKMLSIDLSKGNFQALKYIDKDICFGANTYDEFIGKYTDLDYVKQSKYTRQVVFGKLNPSRQITVEKFLMKKFDKYIKEYLKDSIELITLNNDELIYLVNDDNIINNEVNTSIIKLAEENLGIMVKSNFVTVETIKFTHPNESVLTIFSKKNLLDETIDYKCMPSVYVPQILRLLNNETIEIDDMVFYYEGKLSLFLSPLALDKENSSYYK